MLFRMWLFTAAAIATVALFHPRPETAREWMHGQVAEVIDDRTFGFQPDGQDFWFTVHFAELKDKSLAVGQGVEVQPIEFETDGAMKARVRR
jgi:hypothetical protein